MQTSTVEKTYKTLPYIDVVECNVANTSAVSEGETIFMSVKLDNPLGMSIESVVINGVTYGVTGASTKNKIFVEIIYNGQFAGGDTYLKIDKVNAKLNDVQFVIEPKSEISDNVFINGKLEVLKIEFVNEDFEPIDWAFPSDTIYVMITLDNTTGYNLESVNESITSLVKLDNNHWYYEIEATYTGWNTQSLTTLSYSLNDLSKTIYYSQIQTNLYKVASDETKYITTPEDLKQMDDGYYYELKNDIDLSGLEWIGAEFEGVFDGKEYSIKNMSFVGTIKNTSAYLGLFSRGLGVITNLHIQDATIIVDIISDDGDDYNAYCGGIVGYIYGINTIRNCEINSNSILNIRSSNGTCQEIYAGGLIGSTGSYLSLNTFINCKNEAYVCGNFAGGILGRAYDPTIAFINCINGGDISGNTAGGILGFVESDHGVYREVLIQGCVNAGYINSTENYSAGGIIGYVEYNTVVIITATFSAGTIQNEWDGETCSTNQLNSKEFYTETLGWSEDVWDFSALDIENGKYPKLK